MTDGPASEPGMGQTNLGSVGRMSRLWREVGPLRTSASLVLLIVAILLARYSWGLGFAVDIERVLFDVRSSYAMERVEQDERITIVTYEEDTLLNTGVRSPLDREILANALVSLDTMRPRAIAIDILIDQPTDNDEMLIDALNAMQTPTFLAFVTTESNENLRLQPRHRIPSSRDK
jgi:adenylate cyclase